MRGFRVSIVLSVAFVIMGHAPGAWACSCLGPSSNPIGNEFRNADVVFVGTVINESAPKPSAASGMVVTWTFKTSSVQKGAVASLQAVESAQQEPTCGFIFTVGRRYQVFAFSSGKTLTTDLCSGTHLITANAPVLSNTLAHTGIGTSLLFVGLVLVGAGFFLQLRFRFSSRH